MKKLQLPLKREWFEMTAHGIKTEDYREITPYWCSKFLMWNGEKQSREWWENMFFKGYEGNCGVMIKSNEIKVLIACEESQEVCKAFRELGFEAYSCDILPCSEGHPEWHIQGDAIKEAYSGKYDMMIAHPPCTYMSKAGARWMYPTAGNLDAKRFKQAMEAKDMFLKLLNAPIKYIAIENPVPLKVVGLQKHSQAVQPYEYGHEYSKKTLLWLKNLPLLKPTDIKENYKPYLPSNTGGAKRGQKFMYKNITQKESSKTFEGIARAMANQWGNYILNSKNKQL